MAPKASRRSKAVDFLEELQRHVGRTKRRRRSAHDKAIDTLAAKRVYDAHVAGRARLARELGIPYEPPSLQDMPGLLEPLRTTTPSRFEDPKFYFIIQSLNDLLPIKLKNAPLLGTLPLPQMNAMAIKVPDTDESIIVFHETLFGLLDLMAKVIARAVPVEIDGDQFKFVLSEDGVRTQIKENPEIAARFAQALVAYVFTADPYRATPDHLPPPYGFIAERLSEASMLFVLAHEYAHVVRGELDRPAKPVQIGEMLVERVTQSWSTEYGADDMAMIFTLAGLRAHRQCPIPMGYWGAELVFSVAEIIDRAIVLAGFGREPYVLATDTHPGPSARRHQLQWALKDMARDGEGSTAQLKADFGLADVTELDVQGAVAFSQIIETAFTELWSVVGPQLGALHHEGYRPARVWLAYAHALGRAHERLQEAASAPPSDPISAADVLVGLFASDHTARVRSAERVLAEAPTVVMAVFHGLAAEEPVARICREALSRVWPEIEPAMEHLEWFARNGQGDAGGVFTAQIMELAGHITNHVQDQAREISIAPGDQAG